MISKHLILLVLIALCIFALPVQFLSAAESAQTAPSQSDAEADTEKAKPTEVIIIGTMHGTHNKAKQYTVDELRKILLALKPAAICVEMFKGNIGDDGTLTEQALKDRNVPEVPVVDQAARTLGIRLFAIEWEERNDYWRETKYWEHHRRLNELFEQFLGESSKSNPQSLEVKIARLQEQVAEAQRLLGIHGSPEVINSGCHDNVVRAKHLLVMELIEDTIGKRPGYEEIAVYIREHADEWNKRNGHMADNIARIASQFPGKRIVVITGAEHRYILRDLLSEKPNIVLKEFWEAQAE